MNITKEQLIEIITNCQNENNYILKNIMSEADINLFASYIAMEIGHLKLLESLKNFDTVVEKINNKWNKK